MHRSKKWTRKTAAHSNDNPDNSHAHIAQFLHHNPVFEGVEDQAGVACIRCRKYLDGPM